MPGISVVLCCFNSHSRILDTLKNLAAQEINENLSCELILVDNASTDQTGEFSIEQWNKCGSPFPLKIVHEERQGLSFARRTGVLNSNFDIVIFCDDDNWLAPEYFRFVNQIMRANPRVGMLGGQSCPVLENKRELPNWFVSYARCYAVGVQALRSGPISGDRNLWGAGLAIRAEFLVHLYRHEVEPLLIGRAGASLTSGGDDEIGYWYRMGGYQVYYDERLKLSHFMPESRVNLEYLERLLTGFSSSSLVIGAYREWLCRPKGILEYLRSPILSLRKELRFLRSFHPYLKHFRKLSEAIRIYERKQSTLWL